MLGKVRVFCASEIIRSFCSSDNEQSTLHALISQFFQNKYSVYFFSLIGCDLFGVDIAFHRTWSYAGLQP